MEDNEEEEEEELDMEDLYEQDIINQNHILETDLNDLSELNLELSTIYKETTFPITSVKSLKEMLNNIKIPYPNNNEIPLIRIKDENYFENNIYIENYIKSLVKFDDNKFNTCRLCFEKQNKFFCKNCKLNICDKCYEICKANNHKLKGLEN